MAACRQRNANDAEEDYAMIPEEINIAIAKVCGWGTCPDNGRLFAKWKHYETGRLAQTDEHLPNYHGDLNACAEMEKMLTDEQWDTYADYLLWEENPAMAHSNYSSFRVGRSATAPQCCEAFLKTLNIWKE